MQPIFIYKIQVLKPKYETFYCSFSRNIYRNAIYTIPFYFCRWRYFNNDKDLSSLSRLECVPLSNTNLACLTVGLEVCHLLRFLYVASIDYPIVWCDLSLYSSVYAILWYLVYSCNARLTNVSFNLYKKNYSLWLESIQFIFN